MSRRVSKPQACKPNQLITPAIIEGRYRSSRYPGPEIFAANSAELARAYQGAAPHPRKLAPARLFSVVEQRSSILHVLRPHRYKVVPYLIDVAQRCADWVRAPEDWHPKLEPPQRQLVDLLRHLFAQYRTPRWFSTALEARRGRPARQPEFSWFVHLGQGGNLRSAPALPLALTRRAAHEATLAPAKLSPRQALLWGQLRAFGGSTELVTRIMWSAAHLKIDDVWLKLFEKMLRSAGFLVDDVQPLVAYVHYRRFQADDRASFSLEHHSIAALLARMRHRELERAAAVWQRTSGLDFTQLWLPWLDASSFQETTYEGTWRVHELCSVKDVWEEGVRMRHCVGQYASSCVRGENSIFSLTLTRNNAEVRRVTIRVRVAERAIVEARRLANARIDERELCMIRKWAEVGKLQVMPGI